MKMKQTTDRSFTTWVPIKDAVPYKTGLVATHLRVDITHWASRGYDLFVKGVDRKEPGCESMMFPDDREHRVRIEVAPRFNRKKLEVHAAAAERMLEARTGIAWESVLKVLAAHGAEVAE